MKIQIVTIHCIPNFGSIFQSYALVTYLCNQGYRAELIDYRPSYYAKGRNAFKRLLGIVMNYSAYIRQHKKYEDFINAFLPKGEVYHTLEELYEIPTEDTCFIVGGDQLWNNFHTCGRDDVYKLTFVSGCKKIAYGTSMGRNTFDKIELEELAKKISDFYSIGLREQSTVWMFQPYTKVPIYHAADPVLLLGVEDYMKFIGKKRLIKEPYLVMYLAAKSELLSRTVEYIAKRKGLKVVHVCGFKKKCKCDYFLKDTGPEELLNLIYYSDFVVSASFHATLFSILFQKQFCTLLPEVGTNARIEDLLSYFELSERIIHNQSEIANVDLKINFESTISIKNVLVSESKEQLLKAINS